jgi:hypothetical protein
VSGTPARCKDRHRPSATGCSARTRKGNSRQHIPLPIRMPPNDSQAIRACDRCSGHATKSGATIWSDANREPAPAAIAAERGTGTPTRRFQRGFRDSAAKALPNVESRADHYEESSEHADEERDHSGHLVEHPASRSRPHTPPAEGDAREAQCSQGCRELFHAGGILSRKCQLRSYKNKKSGSEPLFPSRDGGI